MKTSMFLLFLFLPTIAFAQDVQNMNQGDMQKMMEQAQKMQVCIQNIDQEKLLALEQRSEQFGTEIKALCDSGKRDKAQEKAMSFAKEMAKDPTVLQMGKCGEMMQGAMPDMMADMPFMDQEQDGEQSSMHVCDE